jgi:WD40 repeat protein
VETVKFSMTGNVQLLVSSGLDRAFVVWDVATATQRARLLMSSGVSSAVWIGARLEMAAACIDGTIHVVDVIRGAVRRTLHGHREAVLSVDSAADGAFIVSGGDDNLAHVFMLS